MLNNVLMSCIMTLMSKESAQGVLFSKMMWRSTASLCLTVTCKILEAFYQNPSLLLLFFVEDCNFIFKIAQFCHFTSKLSLVQKWSVDDQGKRTPDGLTSKKDPQQCQTDTYSWLLHKCLPAAPNTFPNFSTRRSVDKFYRIYSVIQILCLFSAHLLPSWLQKIKQNRKKTELLYLISTCRWQFKLWGDEIYHILLTCWCTAQFNLNTTCMNRRVNALEWDFSLRPSRTEGK